MKASEAFSEDAPLPRGALAALSDLNEKDATIDRYRKALERIVDHEVAGFSADIAQEALDA